ncbi:MAG TPA: hypothetical protein PKA43_00245 [Candidatus Competibacter phosphatis]|nr:hypothetical protein [Candidatus Competibacter phosphatis]
MKHLIIVAALVALLWPATVKASCSGFLDCLLGMTERTEVRAQRDIERERIQAQRDADIARIDAEAQERVRVATAEVERVRQQRFATEAQRDVAIAQAQQQAEQYKAMIAGLVAEREAAILANADTQIAALQAQAEIATAGILETGRTERYRIVGGWAFSIVAIVAIAILLGLGIRRHQAGQTIVLLADPGQYRRLQSHANEIEVTYAKHHITRR